MCFCLTPATSGWRGPGPFPGTPGLMHRIGGLEKQDVTGNVSYDPANHEHMVNLRAAKIAGIAADIPKQEVTGPAKGRLLVLSWGGTFGACATAVRNMIRDGESVAHAHLRYLNPLPANLGEILEELRSRAHSGIEPGATAALDSRRVLGSGRRAEQDSRQAVYDP